MGSLLLPGTDTAVVVEGLVVFPLLVAAAIAKRHDPEVRIFVVGLFAFAVAFFGFRALH